MILYILMSAIFWLAVAALVFVAGGFAALWYAVCYISGDDDDPAR